MIRELAPAKVNLFLHVGNKRPDGYHELESLVVFASVGDELTFEEADELSLKVEGPFASALADDQDNLVLRAARKFAEFAQVEPKVQIMLTKNLPVASGIGGGSGDAGATLRGLSRLWPGRLTLPQLWNIGHDLGSDVPVSVLPGCWWMTGRGERFLTVRDVGTLDALLINAGVPVSTAEVYEALDARTGIGKTAKPAHHCVRIAHFAEYLSGTRNDLEAPARALSPAIGEALEALAEGNPLVARMSGSGGTCFALYPDAVSAQMAAENISREHPNWWIAPTKLNYGRKWKFQ